MLEQDPSTKQIYGSEIWYAPGDDTLLKPGVYYALEAPQQFANLRLHGNGGTLRNGSNLVVKSTLCVGDEPAIPVGGNPGFARSGYRFDGWQRESGDPINSNMDIHNNVQMDLYAIWTPIVDTTKVHFRDDEGRKQWSFDLNSPFTTPNPAADQYCFWGWANGDPARVGFNEQTLVIGPELFWADAGTTLTRQDSETFYAWYGPKHFTTVRYHGNGGTRGANGDLMVRCAMVIDTGLEVGGDWGFTRPGYQFSGWVDDRGRSYSPRQSIGSGVVDLTAQWSKPVDFGIALNPKTSKIFVVLYSGDRLLTVLENGWNTQMYLPEDLYAQADRAVLFQMDGSSRPTAAAAELTFPRSK